MSKCLIGEISVISCYKITRYNRENLSKPLSALLMFYLNIIMILMHHLDIIIILMLYLDKVIVLLVLFLDETYFFSDRHFSIAAVIATLIACGTVVVELAITEVS